MRVEAPPLADPHCRASHGSGKHEASAPLGWGLSMASPSPLPLCLPPWLGTLARWPGQAPAEPSRALEQPHHLMVLVVQHPGQEERGLLCAARLETPAGPALTVDGHVPQSLGAGLAPGPWPAGHRRVQPGGVGVITQLVDPLHKLTLGVVVLLRGAGQDTVVSGSAVGPGSHAEGGKGHRDHSFSTPPFLLCSCPAWLHILPRHVHSHPPHLCPGRALCRVLSFLLPMSGELGL